jgi:hypothetical protein
LRDLLLITPPFTQLNTPYPATAYIKGFLNTKNLSAYQVDLGIEVILNIFSKEGLQKLFDYAFSHISNKDENINRIYSLRHFYISKINEVILFLQGHNNTLARQVCSENYLPQASRFNQLDDLEWAFGSMGIQDKAKHLCTLFIEDLADFIKICVDPHFGFSRYAEKLGMSANSFDELHKELNGTNTYVDEITLKLLEEKIKIANPKLVCFSVPFPGNLYSAFKCAQYIKKEYPKIKIAMGGGFPNTELRSLKDIRVFDFFDFISLDDGELPLEIITSNILNATASNPDLNFFKRTFIKENNQVLYNNFSLRPDYKQEALGTPDYSDLLLEKYISVIEIVNPMHSLWSDGRWNKLTMAHGCYWGKCTFCDVSLDYIKLYEPLTATMIVDRMENLILQTGERGFHFVDEAAPPALMRAVALEILKRDLKVSWWTNIRFEKSFTNNLCKLLQASGCIAVSGGLEVASDRLLKLIQKGVTVEQVSRVCQNLETNGIMVHAYLMYGYPTQTIQETIDSLEMVRQMFEQGVLRSGFWHQFAMTAHSPVGLDPEAYRVTPLKKEITFADNEVAFEDSTGIDHSLFSYGLKKSLFNYMHRVCFEYALQEWFDFEIPQTTIQEDYIARSLEYIPIPEMKSSTKLVWLGGESIDSRKIEGSTFLRIKIHLLHDIFEIDIPEQQANWLLKVLPSMTPSSEEIMTYGQLKNSYENEFEDFTLFWYTYVIGNLNEVGLLIL